MRSCVRDLEWRRAHEGELAGAVTRSRARCGHCGKLLAATHRFCPKCGTPVGTALPPTVAVGPSLQVRTTRADALEEQRKVVTVMFVDLAGSTAAAERLDPEEWRRVLQRYFAVLAKEIDRFGGTIDKYIGDAVMAVFGAPIAREDDPHRAVSAALAIKADIAQENAALERQYKVRLNLRIGINSGEVIAGLLEGGVEGAYTVTGDTVNTAQRLESAAPPNEILVGEATYQLTRRAFVFDPVPPLTLKGKKEPVPAYLVAFRERRAVPREARPPFVGRGAELELLRQFFAEASAGRGQIVHVHGEAGMGKSRLMQEFLASLPQDVTRLWPRCTSYESETPYALVADFIRRAFSVQRGEQEPVAAAMLADGLAALKLPARDAVVSVFLEVLGYGARSGLDPEKKRRLLGSVLRRFVESPSRRGTLVVVAEDVHWMDAASASLLTEILPALAALPCLFLSTSRDAPTAWPATTLPLEPLGEGAATEMLDRVSPVALDPATRSTVLTRTAGNPFFIEELVRSLSGRAAGTVPATIQELLQARLDRLSPAAKRLAQRAAIVGRIFSTRLLAELVPGETLEQALTELEAEGFIAERAVVPERVYIFRHALTQEAAYQVQLIAQRKTLHGNVGAAIEALYAGRLEEFVDVLALHYGRSDVDPKARTYLLLAAQRAQRLYAGDEALHYFRQTLERSGDDREVRFAAREGIGDVERFAGRYAEALESYAQSMAELGLDERIRRSRMRRKTGAIRQLQGDRGAALEELDAALAELPGDADRERAAVLIEVGLVRWLEGRFDEAVGHLTEGVALAERADAQELRADALKHLGTVYVLRGEVATALEHYERSLATYESIEARVDQANVLNNIGIVRRRQGAYAEAVSAHERALAIRASVGDPLGIGTTHCNLGDLYRSLGDLDRAGSEYRAALEVWSSIGYAIGVNLAHVGLGVAAVESGDAPGGREQLLAAHAEWERLGSRTYVSETQRYIALSYLGDDPHAALEWAERSVAAARDLHEANYEGAALLLVGRARAALGDVMGAVEALERSAAILRGTPERQELGRTLLDLGLSYRALEGDDPRRAESEALIAEARAIFEQLGAVADLRRHGEIVTAAGR